MSNRKYAEDRPGECRYCYFWNPRYRACELGEDKCYYLLPEEKEKKSRNPCDGCAYAKNTPCIGYCLKQVMGKEGGQA